jgi:uncharacterized protein YdeI (YjbR/CyaY-like superfamily)
MKFRAVLESTGPTAAGFEVPDQIVDDLGGGSHPKVTVTVNEFTYSKQLWHTTQIEAAKTPETRSRRIAKSIDLLIT